MHELSITQGVVDACSQRAGDRRVRRVTVEIGMLTCVMPDSLRFCFDIVARGTPLEGAELAIIRVPGRSRCQTCGSEVAMTSLLARCACGSDKLDRPAGGDRLNVKSMELEDPILEAT